MVMKMSNKSTGNNEVKQLVHKNFMRCFIFKTAQICDHSVTTG